MGAAVARRLTFLGSCIMRVSSKPKAILQSSDRSDSLVPPAVKGITLGFIGGMIAVLALTLMVPSGQSTEAGKANKTGAVGVR